MPKTPNYDPSIHSRVHLAMSLLCLLALIGVDIAAVKAGLAVCYYLLSRS